MSKKQNTKIASGKRKTAIAKATIKAGTGIVTVNGTSLDVLTPTFAKMKIQTPLLLIGDDAKKYDINVRVNGGGFSSNSEAASLAIAKVLVMENKKLEQVFLDYDRHLLIADVRRRESRKPNTHGKARSKRQKSYR